MVKTSTSQKTDLGTLNASNSTKIAFGAWFECIAGAGSLAGRDMFVLWVCLAYVHIQIICMRMHARNNLITSNTLNPCSWQFSLMRILPHANSHPWEFMRILPHASSPSCEFSSMRIPVIGVLPQGGSPSWELSLMRALHHENPLSWAFSLMRLLPHKGYPSSEFSFMGTLPHESSPSWEFSLIGILHH